MNLKKLGDLKISIKMGGLEKVQMRIAERIRATKTVFSKLSAKSKNVVDEISESLKCTSESFEDFCKNIDDVLKKKGQEFNKNVKQLIDNIAEKTKLDKPADTVETGIEGDMSAEDVGTFLTTLWNNHEMAQEKFIDSGDETYGEMALDIKVAINNIEEIRSYLIDHGRIDKVKYDYSFE